MHQTIIFTGKNTGCTEAGNLAWPNAHSLHFPSTTPRWEHDTLTDRPYTGTATPTPAHNTRIIALLCLLLTAWTNFLFIESTRPPAALFGLIPHLDKAAHFCAFSILGILACGLSLTFPPPKKPRIPIISMPLLVVTLCGLLEECLQMFVACRVASIFDLLADLSGGIFAILVINRTRATQGKTSSNKE